MKKLDELEELFVSDAMILTSKENYLKLLSVLENHRNMIQGLVFRVEELEKRLKK